MQDCSTRLRFEFDPVSGWYLRQHRRIKFPRIPAKLKVEPSGPDRSGGPSAYVTGPHRAKGNVFYSDLRELPAEGWSIGKDSQHDGKRLVQSLVLFEFSSDRPELTVHYFKDFYLLNVEERTRHAVAFIQDQQRQGAA